MQEKNTVEQLKSIIADRDKKIKYLENELKNGSENRVKFKIEPLSQQLSLNDDSFVLSRPPSNYQTDKKRPPSSGNQVNRTESLSSKDSLNMKVIEQRKEQNLDYKLENSELKTLYKSSEVERLRLLDLVKTLQKRIDEYNEKSLDMENKYNEQRRKLAHAEKQLERLKLVDSKNVNSAKKQTSANNFQSIDNIKLDELETGLLIQKDENDALKAALKSTLEAKEEDLRLYCEMLESTKTVFLEGLKQYKNLTNGESSNLK